MVALETENACAWQPGIVRLHDGRQVERTHPEWMAECEARYVLRLPPNRRGGFLARMAERNPERHAALLQLMRRVEPAYVLDLPNKPQRLAYMDQVMAQSGPNVHDTLRAAVLALNDLRKTWAPMPVAKPVDHDS